MRTRSKTYNRGRSRFAFSSTSAVANQPEPLPRFPLGQVVATPAALEVLTLNHASSFALLQRHLRGDWGELDPTDAAANDAAVAAGGRILSSYRLPDGSRLWVITEADRSVTTILRPEDY